MTRKPICWLVHGYNVSDKGAGTTDLIRPYVESRGYRVEEIDYGHFDLIDVRTQTDAVADRLRQYAQPLDVFIGHSHAGTIFAKAVDSGASFAAAVLIHPALRADWCIPEHSKCRVTVFANPTDYATWIAYLLRLVSPGNLVWGKHWWGAMGSIGATCDRMTTRLGAWGHSSGFRRIEKWGPRWASCLPDLIWGHDD